MGVQVTFDGHLLNDILEITDGFTLFDGADFNPTFLDKTRSTGGRFIDTHIEKKTIEMPFIIRNDVQKKYDILMQILNVQEPKKLIFSSRPNIEYLAIPKGKLDTKESFLEAKGTINWTIADGVGKSSVRVRVPFKRVAPGVLEAMVVNNGTDWATVDYNIKMNHENGYIGIISEYGAIEIGNPGETDYVPAEHASVLLTQNNYGDFSNWKPGTVNYENPSKSIATTMGYSNEGHGQLGILTPGFTNIKNDSFYGALQEFTWNNPCKNWYIWARARFETGLMGQTGAWCLSVIDKNNKMIAGMAIEKTDTSGNRAMIHFLAPNDQGSSSVKHTIYFTPSYWIPPNPYGEQSMMANRDMFDIKKEGKRLTFFYYGGYYPMEVPIVENMEANRLQFYVGQYKDRPTDANNSRLVTRMYLNDLFMYANKVPYMRDVPNKYPSGSTIYIDGEARKPYFNNQLRLDDEIFGSEYFKIPPGKETKIQITYSEFSVPEPSAYAIVNEVWV